MGKIRTQLCYESPRFTLCGVSDVVFDKAQQIAERFETTAFKDFDSIIQHFNLSPILMVEEGTSEEMYIHERAIDAIIISVPTDFHGVYIRQAAKYGLAVFVEKPVAETPDEISELYDLCSASRVPLCCGFQRRFDPSYVDAARAIHESKIGDRPISAHIFFGDSPGPPMSFLKSRGGEIFMDLCVHGKSKPASLSSSCVCVCVCVCCRHAFLQFLIIKFAHLVLLSVFFSSTFG